MTEDTKKKAGRPTKYRPEYCEEAIRFFDSKPYEEVEVITKVGLKETKTTKKVAKLLPTLVEFSRKIGINYCTLTRWCDPKHGSYREEFCNTITRACKPLQKNFLIQAGLLGFYNPQAFKFVAVNITDMVDKKDVGLQVGEEVKKFANWLEDRDLELPAAQAKALPSVQVLPTAKAKEAVLVVPGAY